MKYKFILFSPWSLRSPDKVPLIFGNAQREAPWSMGSVHNGVLRKIAVFKALGF